MADFEDFTRELKRAPRLHKAATAQAMRLVQDLGPGLIIQHRPFLDLNEFVAEELETRVP